MIKIKKLTLHDAKNIIVRNIPSVITLSNLVLGFFSIIFTINSQYKVTLTLIIICMFLDFLDGKVARILGVSSSFGKELDSLSDVVSFGVAPAVFTYTILPYNAYWVSLILAIYLICGVCRLARFNVSSNNNSNFSGFPITTAGGLLALLSFYYAVFPPSIFFMIVIALSISMVSRIPFFSVKKSKSHNANLRYSKWFSLLLVSLFGVIVLIYPFVMAITLILYYLSGLTLILNHFQPTNLNSQIKFKR
ncbi:CDP-diacylglycerol--serine O-phosphatidyltransferase [Natranaerofaba carboxydovora]|uniref:CDP-diacylglycerol--serine O-phosphatidyltransferase n=1 Tax=Natranaerofaba carboxydovora TaxID=2742683 RepID=UPI001F1411CB|nr:CDP-diacylglycerol--serine O-phosphatidyltransferase [Natranaerofaba carboxydovora]UMZ74248.1 Phosphatidylcholine synthase [Natranaerofaba carboxydovora]